MAEQNKHIDDLFRESLGDYSEVPDASVWSDIAQKLDATPAPGTPGSGGGSGAAAILGKGKILLMVVGAAALFFAARWATGNFGTVKPGNPTTEIRAEQPATRINELPEETGEEKLSETPAQSQQEPAKANSTEPISPAKDVAHTVPTTSANTSSANRPVSVNRAKPVSAPTGAEATRTQSGSMVKKNALPKVPKEVSAKPEKVNEPTLAGKPAAHTTERAKVPQSVSAPVTATLLPPDKPLTQPEKVNKPTVAGKSAANNAGSAKVPQAVSAPVTAAIMPPAKPLIQPEKEKIPTAPEEPLKPKQPEELPAPVQPRIKEELSALFFKGSMQLLHSEQPDIDYGFLDTDKGLERIVKMLKRRMESGELEAGIKAGIEAGFKKYTMNKLVVMPYLRYSVSRNLSVLLQPGFKFGRLSRTDMGTSAAYYSITNSSVTANHIIVNAADTLAPDTITRRYLYNQTYDSLNIGYATERRNYFEFELPVMLQYNVTKNFSVYGGINFMFGKTIRLKENRQEFKGLSKSNTVSYAPVPVTEQDPIPPSIDSMFSYNATPYTGSVMPAQNPLADPLRVGYMIGVNYKIGKRWTAEIMVQQMLNNANYIPDEKVRTIHKQPYVRIGVGYRLFKDRR